MPELQRNGQAHFSRAQYRTLLEVAEAIAVHRNRVTGIDFVEEDIRHARAKAAERGRSVQFLARGALALAGWGERFASVIDRGLFHVFSDDHSG